MFLESLNRHLQVASVVEAQRLTQLDRKFWNVVSIRGPIVVREPFTEAKRVHYAVFPDMVPDEAEDLSRAAHREDLAAIHQFVDKIPGEPLLVHCQVGISRSTAVALGIIVRTLAARNEPVEQAIDLLLQVRPKASPNEHVLQLGLELFMTPAEAKVLARRLSRHERFRTTPR